MDSWHRWAILGGVLVATIVVAWLLDHLIGRRRMPPEMVTRYRILRRSIVNGTKPDRHNWLTPVNVTATAPAR